MSLINIYVKYLKSVCLTMFVLEYCDELTSKGKESTVIMLD